jgi:hypothetical protein
MLRRRRSMRATAPSGEKETQKRSKPVAQHGTGKVKVDARTIEREDQNPQKPGSNSERAFRDFLRPPGLTAPSLSWVKTAPKVRPEEKISR